MKKTNNLLKRSLGVACLAGLLTVGGAKAVTVPLEVGLSDSHAIGDVIATISGAGGLGQAERDAIMANTLLDMALNTTQTIDGNHYERSGYFAPPLPDATAVGAVIASAGGLNNSGNSVLLTLGTKFRYLVAVYDGQNGGVEVWDIADIAAGTVLDIPRYAQPTTPGKPGLGPLINGANAAKFQMTGWTLLNPNPQDTVPDGGLTLVLLGSALAGLAAFRRK